MPIIACNIGSYRQYRDTAYAHLAKIGLTNVELPCPQPDQVENVQKDLSEYGLTATSLTVQCPIEQDSVVAQFTQSLDTVAQMDVHTVFTSVKAGELDRTLVYDRLRQIGDAAQTRNLTIVMETHPDLITNGDIARETMEAINHPNVRVNFDTANLYYYNKNITATGELDKIIDYVAAVHLKDTNGEFKTWHFPALGEGVIDFPTIFSKLSAKEFNCPYTFELEGIEGETLNQEDAEARVANSLTYLQEKGLI